MDPAGLPRETPAAAANTAGGHITSPLRVERRSPPVARSAMKRVFDLVGSAALGLALSPFLVLIAAAIRLDSKGPVLFRQERVCQNGRTFTCLKFRSMKVGSDDHLHRRYVEGLITGRSVRSNGNGIYKLTDDDRVTRVGAWLRRTSLDELPQLWNVLRGHMSLVGPRPPLPYEVDLYEPWQLRRLECRPGLTGLWQVSGRNQLAYRDMCELDLQYIRDWSHGLDMRILLRTIPVVLFNSGEAQ